RDKDLQHYREIISTITQHNTSRHRVLGRLASVIWRVHSAAAHFAESLDGFRGKFFLLFPFLDERAHLRLHELADGVANQFLVVLKGKVHQSIVRGLGTMVPRACATTMSEALKSRNESTEVTKNAERRLRNGPRHFVFEDAGVMGIRSRSARSPEPQLFVKPHRGLIV